MNISLDGKTAVVTGASSGLGKAVSQILSKKGVKVFALARSIQETDLPSSVVKVPMNIRDVKSIDEAFAAIDTHTKSIDFLINCAGRSLVATLEDSTREEIMDVMGINLKGNIFIAQEVYRRMIPKKSGHIVQVISTSGLKGRSLETIYCASKWGIRGFTESLRQEAREHGIRVSAVFPGGMKSENFWKTVPGKKLDGYIHPDLIAAEIIHLLTIDAAIAPTELTFERG